MEKAENIEKIGEEMMKQGKIPARVVDLHSHMLPHVDDGAADFETTKKMIRLAYSEGCRHLFLTPHSEAFKYEDTYIPEKMNAIREWIDAEHMDLKIYPGTEIFVDPEWEDDTETILKRVKSGIYSTLNGSNYVLIEFLLHHFEFAEVRPSVEALMAAGYTPIIAHAERYETCYDEVCQLKEMGCLLQMNICDLYQDVENEINRMAHRLLRDKMFDFVGTDAHGIDRRPPKWVEYTTYLYQNYEKEYVDAILWENAVNRLGLE